MGIKIKPLVKAGSEIFLYSSYRNWRFAKEVYAQCKVLAEPKDNGQVPLCQKDTDEKFPYSELTYRAVSERELYEGIIEGQVCIGKYEQALSTTDTNFGILWDAFCNGQFKKAREINREATENPVLWVNVAIDGTNCKINRLSYTYGSENDIKFEILSNDHLLPQASYPNLLRAAIMFNSIIDSMR
ncbi:hypothetical protein HY212_03870 [Candidatus Pacearchaeota archaeon]|nr:hypothetical protein [Candidatus Pacearchaeota archaeon]